MQTFEKLCWVHLGAPVVLVFLISEYFSRNTEPPQPLLLEAQRRQASECIMPPSSYLWVSLGEWRYYSWGVMRNNLAAYASNEKLAGEQGRSPRSSIDCVTRERH
jgi:hypothetical protein